MSGEHALCISAARATSSACCTEPARRAATPAVVIVVGGPQYRVGSHRQFVLLARQLCTRGTPVLRFDQAGMGDSAGDFAGFEHVDDDIRAAIDELQTRDPALSGVCLWGLCDGASAALMYAYSDPRVTHLVLANPWVRTQEGQAQTYFAGYYDRRLRSPSFWRRIFSDPAAARRAAWDFLRNLGLACAATAAVTRSSGAQSHFLSRMLRGARMFRGRVLVLLSGRDQVAAEFDLLLRNSGDWSGAFGSPQVRTCRHPQASHTFSRRAWRDWAAQTTAEFIEQ